MHKPGCIAQAKVFRSEMTRRLVQDCIDVIEHMGTKRPDVRIRMRPIDYEGADEIVWAEVVVTAREGSRTAEDGAYITPGTPRAQICIEMQQAVDRLDAKLRGQPAAA